MPCNHKFINDLQLDYVDWNVKTLFIGTFNPGWIRCPNNYANWFYGRTNRNEFWKILPIIYHQEPLLNGNRNIWIEFCRQNEIAITDIIESIDAEENNPEHLHIICRFRDDQLGNFNNTINDVPAILDKFKSIKQICITRQTLTPFVENCFADTFQYINNHPERNFILNRLRSPSRGAINGVVGEFGEFVAQRWLEQGYLVNP